MLGGACDEQFLDVYRRPHDPPEGGGCGACLRDAGRRPWGCRARRRRFGRWTVGGHRDQGRQAGDRFDERVPHDPLTVYVFSTPYSARLRARFLLGCLLGCQDAQRGPCSGVALGTRSGKISDTETAAPLIRQTGTPKNRTATGPLPREEK